MEKYSLLSEWKKRRSLVDRGSLGFVPTMGSLHEGHLELIRRAKQENDFVVCSIYVNPTQFDNKEDFLHYPSHLERDILLLENEGCDFLLLPSFQELYHDNYSYVISEKELSRKLCGAHRPGHFDGVLTVVMKLLNITQPTKAYFGEKDYQQLLLVKKMVEAFFLPVKIVAVATVRENDGLAMSSRNQRLSPEMRLKASLFAKYLANMDLTPKEVKEELEKEGFVVDYIEEENLRRFGAVKLGDIRLIDNREIKG